VVVVVVWCDPHLRPAGLGRLGAALEDGDTGAQPVSPRTALLRCHSGYSRPQDVRHALYFLYPKISQPGDFFGRDQSPNLLGTERTGPDLSQEAGWHPDDCSVRTSTTRGSSTRCR